MLKHSVMTAALAVAYCFPFASYAADDQELTQIREQIRQSKEAYESRIRMLENRLQTVEEKSAARTEPAAATAGTGATASRFNPAIALILGGTYANLSQDPRQYRLQGFLPSGDETGPGARSFNLGESELTLSASIDPRFSGRLTFALGSEGAEVEESYFQTQGLSNGLNVKGGRFLSSLGYLNNQHAHAWDFVDAPLAYQAFFGGQYKADGLQLKWLAPTDRFLELGLEAGNGASYPGSDRNKNGIGSTTVFAHLGDDIGAGASWRAGVSYLRTASVGRSYDDTDSTGTDVTNAFTGKSRVWVVDGIYKWAPDGNATQTNFKLQGEYFRSKESGLMTYDTQAASLGTATGNYSSAQSGWYLQGVYQFMPMWRAGLRHDKLYSGTTSTGLPAADFQRLDAYNPKRSSVMLDYSPSEFSRLRIQLARDQSRPGVTDNQVYLQYVMSLGAHGAHAF